MPRSLHFQVFVGSLLWSIGMLVLTSAVVATLVHEYPGVVETVHRAGMSIVAIICIVVGLLQVRRGLSPFRPLRARLAAVREGRQLRVEGAYPAEVQPLVNDLNALLEERERRLAQALKKAGDLAHGLKTPLAVLAHEVSSLRADGDAARAATMLQQVERMRRQVESHLAEARATAAGATPGASCDVAVSAEALARTLGRLNADRSLAIDVRVPPGYAVRVRREDLDEMLGNLLDNACKFARSRVVVDVDVRPGTLALVIDDDGPGLEPSLRAIVLQRGVRADEASPGAGLGLAIVRDLADVHGGTIRLDESPSKGLRARLELPRA